MIFYFYIKAVMTNKYKKYIYYPKTKIDGKINIVFFLYGRNHIFDDISKTSIDVGMAVT